MTKRQRADLANLEGALQQWAGQLQHIAAELDADRMHRCHAARKLRKLATQVMPKGAAQ